jgi:hypothetical protein
MGISENLRFPARLDLSDRIEAEQQDDEQAYECCDGHRVASFLTESP